MQGRECRGGMSKSEMGLRSLGQGSRKRVWDGEGWAGLSTWSFENRTKVCGWMGYAVGDLRTSSGYGEVWIGVPVQCYTECNNIPLLDQAPVKCWDSNSMGTRGYVKEGLELALMGSFKVEQGGCHLQT